jgi:hypothetical protein
MEVRKKIYYVPGMISLIVLPILCYYYLGPKIIDERCIELVVAGRYIPHHNEDSPRFDTSFLSQSGSKRNYFNIILNGNTSEQNNKLKLFHQKIKELIKQNDTINGVHLLFVDSVKYAVFVQALDICLSEYKSRVAVYENNLWVLKFNDSKERIRRILELRKEHQEQNKEEILKRGLPDWAAYAWTSPIRKTWPIFIIFSVLSFVSIRKSLKR